ncbi:hypothetical protein [uncultured Desulfosarcina sp.]|uniref:hypothetical protein n=1 Tax=uncultured Desulfosarcina sp. TaxID=218289 RepID=UPI0029C79080|nr:hypothetical protein [uncultured Desulfosarcina sp.]
MSVLGSNPARINLAIIMRVALVALMLLLTGCMKNYGRFNLDRQVERDFRTGTVQPEFQYYFAGRETMPYAIIGIDRSYTVPSRYWIPFYPEPETLRKMSGNVYNAYSDRPYGAFILGPDGKTIGVWYSTVYNCSVKVDQAQHTVQVLFNNPENDDRPGLAK